MTRVTWYDQIIAVQPRSRDPILSPERCHVQNYLRKINYEDQLSTWWLDDMFNITNSQWKTSVVSLSIQLTKTNRDELRPSELLLAPVTTATRDLPTFQFDQHQFMEELQTPSLQILRLLIPSVETSSDLDLLLALLVRKRSIDSQLTSDRRNEYQIRYQMISKVW